MWQTPITDRTQEDVLYAQYLINEWKGNFAEIQDLKGCLNAADLNRIEGNIQHLADILNERSYHNQIHTKTWERDDIPTTTDVERISYNVYRLMKAFPYVTGVPEIPTSMVHYQNINDIETILLAIYEKFDEVEGDLPQSDTFKSDQRFILPRSI